MAPVQLAFENYCHFFYEAGVVDDGVEAIVKRVVSAKCAATVGVQRSGMLMGLARGTVAPRYAPAVPLPRNLRSRKPELRESGKKLRLARELVALLAAVALVEMLPQRGADSLADATRLLRIAGI